MTGRRKTPPRPTERDILVRIECAQRLGCAVAVHSVQEENGLRKVATKHGLPIPAFKHRILEET